MSDIVKKVLLSIPSAAIGLIFRQVFQAWGIFDPFTQWLGGWLKMHVITAQIEWTVAGILALISYAALYRALLQSRSASPVTNVTQIPNAPGQSSPQWTGSPLEIEFGNDDKHERIEHFNETGIFRRMIYVSRFQ